MSYRVRLYLIRLRRQSAEALKLRNTKDQNAETPKHRKIETLKRRSTETPKDQIAKALKHRKIKAPKRRKIKTPKDQTETPKSRQISELKKPRDRPGQAESPRNSRV